MKVSVFAYSRQGCKTARKVMGFFAEDEIRAFTMDRFAEPGFDAIQRPSKSFYEPIFAWADAMVFVGSVGIAVREIAPFIRSKLTDPAVVTMDELGHFVIPLLSGHIGGANELALQLAKVVDGTPVITTATDINNKFSVDTWAARNGLAITSLDTAKSVSAEILERPVPLKSDFPIVTALPNGVVSGDSGKIGICISYKKEKPFEKTLLLVPSVLHLGIGCRRGTPVENFRDAVDFVLQEHNIHPKAIKQVTSIDIKSNETGLLAFCEERNLPACFYTAEQLWEVPGEFTQSQCVLKYTGVDNVCERSSMIGAEKLLVKKTIRNGVTVAISAEAWTVSF